MYRKSILYASFSRGRFFVCLFFVLCGSKLSVSEGLRVPDSWPETRLPKIAAAQSKDKCLEQEHLVPLSPQPVC